MDEPDKSHRTQRERPTLKTISQLSGLAVTTVSRALNEAPDISDATKARVRAIASDIGYRPDRAGLRLRTGRTNVISLVLSTDHEFMNHTVKLISSVASALRGTSYHLIVTPYFPSEDPMTPIRYLVETGSADGVILNQIEPKDPRVRFLLDEGIPVATHGRTVWCDQHPWFDFDNHDFGKRAIHALASRGRRRIAMIAPPFSQNYSIEMRRGATEAASASGVAFEVITDITSHDRSDRIQTALHSRFERAPRLGGMICASTTSCMAAVAAAEAMGQTLGKEIDVVAKEAMPFLRLCRPAILSFPEDVGAAGTFLAQALLHRIANPGAPPENQLDAPGELLVGMSA
jgi:LacI family transcriptional regulator